MRGQSFLIRQHANIWRESIQPVFIDAIDELWLPGDQDARARRVFGLGDQIGGDVSRLGSPIGDQHDLTWPGDAVDINLAIYMPLCQRYEQIAGADDLVDLFNPFDA